jgi:hypothetical protein
MALAFDTHKGRHQKGQHLRQAPAFDIAAAAQLARLTHRSQALGADLDLHRYAAIECERGLLNIRPPHAARVPLREAHIVAKSRLFAAELTGCHCRITSSAHAEHR